MNEMDELLAQLKAEYEQKEATDKPQSEKSGEQAGMHSGQTEPMVSKGAKLPEGSQAPDRWSVMPPYRTSLPLDNLLAEVKSEFEGQPPIQKQPTQPSTSVKQASSRHLKAKPENNLLQELQTESQEQARLEEERRQQQFVEEQRLQEQRRQRRRQDLARKAPGWLKRLDPKSEEGIWFAEFSYSYDSKLEAAIDYLEALRESQRNL